MLKQGIIINGMILVRHLEVKPPIMTYPARTWFPGIPDALPDAVYIETQPQTHVVEGWHPDALQEMVRWHSIITAPMPHRLILGLEWLGGQFNATQPELADILCTSLDSLKRGISHYRALHRLKSGNRGISLVKHDQPQRQLFDSATH